MKQVFAILFVFVTQFVFGQNDIYNLQFEKDFLDNSIQNWTKKNDGVQMFLDASTKLEGKYALKISLGNPTDEIPGIENNIQAPYEGNEIELSGFIKTKQVQNAYVYIIVGDDNNQFYFDMSPTYSGTADWQKFDIKIPYTSEATKITIACNLEGDGEVWLDNFSLKIDDIDVYKLTPVDRNQKTDSGFNLDKYSEDVNDKLVLIGKLWGYLKYYHPNIMLGDYDWDKELFKILPIVNEPDFESQLETWVTSLGNYEENKVRKEGGDVLFTPDFEWLSHSLLSTELKAYLIGLQHAKRPESNKYVSFPEFSGPEFENDKIYSRINYTDDGMKLLALFRYWNYIEYFYPYKYLIPTAWDDVLQDFVAKAQTLEDELSYILFLQELMGKTEDTHHFIYANETLSSYFGEFKAPVSVGFIENELLIVNSFFEENKLKQGDIILKIDGVSVEELKEKYIKYSVGSNLSATLREVAKKIIRTSDEYIDLLVLREGKELLIKEKTISSNFNPRIKTPILDISKEVGYLHTESLTLKDYDSIFKKWQDKKAIIFDLRTYPEENLGRILTYLHEEPVSFYRSTNTSLEQAGVFSFDSEMIIEPKTNFAYKGKVIVLINVDSQSKAEFSALALNSHPNSILIGNQTAGTDGDVSDIILPGNIHSGITGVGIYAIDKSETQKVGIIPDIEVHPTIQDIKNGVDVILEEALKQVE